MARSRTLAISALLGFTLAACSGGAERNVSPAPTGAGPSCQPYGGCDVLEDLTNGTQRIVTLDTQSYPDALTRALYDAQRSDVKDTTVVGHNPPHDAISGIYHR